jgi:mannose-6-phosphate isomerase-like protein (cupin superfamily)
MSDVTVVHLEDTEIVKFGPDAFYQHDEVLHVLDGTAEAWLEGQEDRAVLLKKGDTIALPPNVLHSFRVVGNEVLRLLGTHVSPRRIVHYRDQQTDSRGYPILDR